MAGYGFRNKKVLIMGLGRFGGGLGALRYMLGQGAIVTVTDTASAERLSTTLTALSNTTITNGTTSVNTNAVTWHLGGHIRNDFITHDVIVVNPAVPADSPWLKIAREHNITLTTEMNIFFERCPARIVGITGSNGKSTTTAMIADVLSKGLSSDNATCKHKCNNLAPVNNNKSANRHLCSRVWLGGNIGMGSLLEKLDSITADDIVVLELSSFQLEDLAAIQRSPHIAVVTNIAPNHLDRHGTMANYVKAKQNILRFQTSDDIAILNRTETALQNWPKLTKARIKWYPDNSSPIKLKLPGRHNQLNAAAALVTAQILGIDTNKARAILAEFEGLPHRLELVGQHNSVRYYNDSIATTPESVIAAIDAFSEHKIIIMGGYDKKIAFDNLAEKLITNGSVQAVIIIGQVQDKLCKLIEKCKITTNSHLPLCLKAATLADAVDMAARQARPGMVILLSPACASYDMFTNFQERGDTFRQLVQNVHGTPTV